MNKNGQKVLLHIDDEVSIRINFSYLLEKHGIVVCSYPTNQDGLMGYEEHKEELDIIVFDGEVPGSTISTPDLIRLIAKEFKGKMVAASGNPEVQKELMRAGCTHAPQSKPLLAKYLLELI